MGGSSLHNGWSFPDLVRILLALHADDVDFRGGEGEVRHSDQWHGLAWIGLWCWGPRHQAKAAVHQPSDARHLDGSCLRHSMPTQRTMLSSTQTRSLASATLTT